MSIPPEVERFFAQERAKQTHIANTQKNLKNTTLLMHNIIEKTNQRGNNIEECELQSEDLVESSEVFYLANLPSWKRWVYTWRAPWWVPSCCTCGAKKSRKRCI